MRIEFITSRGTGHIDLPNDVKSIKIPKGICQNCDEDIEILTHSVITNQQDGSAATDVVDPAKEKVVEDEDGLEKMIPNL